MKIKSIDLYIFTTFSSRLITFIAMIALLISGFIYKSAVPYLKNTATCLLFLLSTFIPAFLCKKTKLTLPLTLQAATVEFLFLSVFLGEVIRFYDKFLWWDDMLHIFSGIMFGFIGFYMLNSLNSGKKAVFQVSRINIFLFVFCFSIAAGTLWEAFEFSADALLGMNLQKSIYVTDIIQMEQYVNKWGRMMDPGLVDTMMDLIFDLIGAIIAASVSLFILKRIRIKNDFYSI